VLHHRLAVLAALSAGVSLSSFLAACGGVASPPPGDAADASPSGSPSGSPSSPAPSSGDAGTPGSPSPTADASPPGADAQASFPAAHSPLPQIPDQGGPILANPNLVTITYPGFTLDSDVSAFGDFVVTSSWLTTAGAEYGIGAGTHTHVVLTDTAPTSLSTSDTAAYLSQQIASGTLPGGVQTQPTNTLYMIFYPPSTSITDMNTAAQCAQSAGTTYKVGAIDHDGTTGGQRFAYAIVSTCPDEGSLGVDWTAAELLMTAATDPYRTADPAYLLSSNDPWFPWDDQLGYLCDFMPPVLEAGYSLPPVWSNTGVRAGTWPCVPAQPGPYFNVSVAPNVTQTIAAGQSITIPVTGWSTAAVQDWTVTAATEGNGFTPTATLATSANTMNNGGATMLSIGVPAGTPSGSLGAVRLHSSRNDGEWLSEWIVPLQVQ
jgi:hypothetical protein